MLSRNVIALVIKTQGEMNVKLNVVIQIKDSSVYGLVVLRLDIYGRL